MRRKPKKQVTECWIILSPNFGLVAPSIRTTKRLCIRDYAALPGNKDTTWDKLKRWGWRCLPIQLVFTPPADL